MAMGGVVSFCPTRETDIGDHRHRRSRHCPAGTHTVNACKIAALASRNLLVIVDDEDSPIKNRAEYAMSPTVAERIEQEVEDELRRRRQCAEANEMVVDEAYNNPSEQKTVDVDAASNNQPKRPESVENRDEVQDTKR